MKKILSLLILVSVLTPALANAYVPAECNAPSVGNNPSSVGNNPSSVGNTGPSSGPLTNPIKGVPNLACLFYRIVDFVMSLSYVVIAIFLLISGFKFVTAQGSEEKLTSAKKTFWYTIIGALILIGANTLIAVFQSLIRSLNS